MTETRTAEQSILKYTIFFEFEIGLTPLSGHVPYVYVHTWRTTNEEQKVEKLHTALR